ncbi:hypothetical protein NDA16_004783 [Ustilago loliicola]|nr:hypothetical protein NDA16_004783 [Ustilago loliicola]
MQATPSLAASAQALTDANVRSWLPARARFSIKNRLFSKNILYSRDIWARGTATWSSTCIFAGLISALAFFAYIYFVKANVSQGSSNQTKPLWQLSSMLADDATINRLDTELDSDEYEDEQQSSRSSGFLANSKERLALRRMLGRNENKRSSIVRIVSSDPTSNLCENPMQVDLEPTTKRSFWPAPVSNTPPSDSSNPNSPTAASPSLSSATPRQASGSPTPAATRRRKESGRLLAGEAGRRQHSASPSPSLSPLSSTSGLPTRPARVRPVDTRSPLSRTARNKRNSTSSLSSADGLNSPKLPPPTTKPAVEEAIWADEAGTPVDERDEAQGTPKLAPQCPTDPSPDSATSGQNKQRSIKLIEPDWRPHIDSHIRARERLDTATRFAAFKMATDGAGAMESKFDSDDVDVNDFWFERFTQSTAAAGRDWDWRKRRARLQRAAALGMALGQSGLASPPAPSPLPGNIGKTDVQLQHQHAGSSEPTSAAQAASPMRKTLPSAPLITFTEQELATAPVLKIDTESGRRDAPLSPALRGNGTPLSPTPSGTGTPLDGIFGAVLPSADSKEIICISSRSRWRT